MIHFGDITKISGYEAPPVDVIVGGSPSQDLSIAGKRAGLDGERSGLFMEQLRIIKEMRENDRRNGRTDVNVRPRYMVWENVPGALSSHGGEDFRIVLEETAKVAEKDASIPMPDKGKWSTSGCVMGNGWSIAWRVLDAQFWGVPQRRRRIALVADFGGQSASEILFVRKSVSGHFEPSEPQRKETSHDASRGFGADDREGEAAGGDRGLDAVSFNWQAAAGAGLCVSDEVVQPLGCTRSPAIAYTLKIRGGCEGGGKGALIQTDKSATLSTLQDQTLFQPVYSIENHPQDSRVNICYSVDQGGGKSSCKVFEDQAPTLTATHDGSPAVAYQDSVIALDRASYNQGKNAQFDIGIDQQGIAHSLVARGPGAVAYCIGNEQVHDAMTPSKEICKTLNCMDDPMKVCIAVDGYKQDVTGGVTKTLTSVKSDSDHVPLVLHDERKVCYWDGSQTVGTLTANNASGNQRMPDKENFNCIIERKPKYIVRRLTPMECERLQGYRDGWTDIGEYTDTNGKKRKSSDAARYKALGNSIALPPWKWVMKRISACYERDATLASLFDGIGGFPYIWEQINGKGSCLWASEIEEFCIAVTKRRIG